MSATTTTNGHAASSPQRPSMMKSDMVHSPSRHHSHASPASSSSSASSPMNCTGRGDMITPARASHYRTAMLLMRWLQLRPTEEMTISGREDAQIVDTTTQQCTLEHIEYCEHNALMEPAVKGFFKRGLDGVYDLEHERLRLTTNRSYNTQDANPDEQSKLTKRHQPVPGIGDLPLDGRLSDVPVKLTIDGHTFCHTMQQAVYQEMCPSDSAAWNTLVNKLEFSVVTFDDVRTRGMRALGEMVRAHASSSMNMPTEMELMDMYARLYMHMWLHVVTVPARERPTLRAEDAMAVAMPTSCNAKVN